MESYNTTCLCTCPNKKSSDCQRKPVFPLRQPAVRNGEGREERNGYELLRILIVRRESSENYPVNVNENYPVSEKLLIFEMCADSRLIGTGIETRAEKTA